MKIIDSYILKKYLSTFIYCLLLFTVIVVVIDLSEKADDFVKSKLTTWQIINQYYIGFIPHLDAMLFPLFIFISVIFFTSKMAERSEIIAILGSGVSYRRFLFPYWIGSFILALSLLLTNHFILPKANRLWGEFLAKYVDVNFGAPQAPTQNYYFRLDSNSYVGLRYYDTANKVGSGFFLNRFKDNQLTYNLRAESIKWDTATKKWNLTNLMERNVSKNNEQVTHLPNRLVKYNFSPVDLRKDDYLKDRLTTPELDAYIKAEKMRGTENLGTFMVERYSRDAIPASVIILTIMGAVLSSRKVRGGSGFHLALGVVLSVIYILFSRLTVVFATKGNFPPILAAWVPNVVFGLLCYYLYKRTPK